MKLKGRVLPQPSPRALVCLVRGIKVGPPHKKRHQRRRGWDKSGLGTSHLCVSRDLDTTIDTSVITDETRRSYRAFPSWTLSYRYRGHHIIHQINRAVLPMLPKHDAISHVSPITPSRCSHTRLIIPIPLKLVRYFSTTRSLHKCRKQHSPAPSRPNTQSRRKAKPKRAASLEKAGSLVTRHSLRQSLVFRCFLVATLREPLSGRASQHWPRCE